MSKAIRIDFTNLGEPVLIGTKGEVKNVVDDEGRLRDLKRQLDILNKEIENAQKKASEILNAANKEAGLLLKNANREIEGAKKEAERIKKQAYEEIEAKKKEIFEKAKKDGYEKGLLEGQNKGYKEGFSTFEGAIKGVEKLKDSLFNERDKLLLSLSNDIARLIMGYVKGIIKLELKLRDDIILGNINAALNHIRSKDSITIILSEDDFEFVQEKSDEIIRMVKGIKNIKFLKLPHIRKGGCEIETNYGSIDATIENQLYELEKLIYKFTNRDLPPKT